jgi:hypothetical protein
MREDGAFVAFVVLRRERGGSPGDAPLGHDRAAFSLQAPLGRRMDTLRVAYGRLAVGVKRGIRPGPRPLGVGVRVWPNIPGD